MNRLLRRTRKDCCNICMILTVALLYVFNNVFLKKCTEGVINDFFTNHFNDLICPVLLLAYCNIILPQKMQIKQIHCILFFVLLVGLFWEYVTPLYKVNAIADVWDIVCYLIGGVVYGLILQVVKRKTLYDKN